METTRLPTSQRDSEFRTLTIITLALLIVAPIAYLVLVYLQAGRIGEPTDAPPTILFYLMLGIAVLQIAVLIPLVQKIMLANPQSLKGAHGGSGSPVIALFMVRLAQLEITYVFGLVTFFISRNTNYLPYFYAIGIFGSLLYWPTRERFDNIANQLEGK